MSEADFYLAEPTAHASWRWAVLMGANSRTYKFALGDALLELAASGRDEVTLLELAAPYAMGIVRRATRDAPQAPAGMNLSATDFLIVAKEEAAASLAAGEPSDRLIKAAMNSIPAMVMVKFHNVRGGGELPHRFYELNGRGTDRTVRLTPELRRIAASPQIASLRAELDARWSIVETAFAAEIGRSVAHNGLAVDLENWKLTDKRRRRSVAGIKEALIGFQHGRCLLCGDLIESLENAHVDHVFPFALMERYGANRRWPRLDLDTVWNLAPAHDDCNAAKSDRLPEPIELERLVHRNEAIMYSPHPLARTLRITLDTAARSFGGAGAWPAFIRAVRDTFS